MKTKLLILAVGLFGVLTFLCASCANRFREPQPIGGSMGAFLRQRDAEARMEALERDEQMRQLNRVK